MRRRATVVRSIRLSAAVVVVTIISLVAPPLIMGAVSTDPYYFATKTKLTATDGVAGDLFGDSMAMSGNYAVVGAPMENERGTRAGAAYVYARVGNAWTQQQKLLATDGVAGQSLGRSVAISGTTIVVGAPGDGGETDPSYAGAAYVFTLSGGQWIQQVKLTGGADALAGDAFGASVAVSGSYAVVGEPWDETPSGTDAGSVFVFSRVGATWTLDQQIQPADTRPGDRLGSSVAISGNTIVAGAPYSDAHWGNDGGVFFFVRGDTKWSQQGFPLAASDAEADALFGSDVAISGDCAVVSAPLDDAGAVNAGAVYVMKRSGTTWNEQQKIIEPDGGVASNQFGRSLAIDGTRIVIGVPYADRGVGLLNSGVAFAYVDSGGAFDWSKTLYAADAAGGDAFGSSVALEGETAVVGALFDDDKGVDSGSAYVFSTVLPTGLSISGPATPPAYGTAPALTAALASPRGTAGAGKTVVFERYSGGVWAFAGGALTNAGGIAVWSPGPLKSAVRFRARFAESPGFEASDSIELVVAPKAWLTTPSGPKTAYRGRAFSSAGYLKSKHPAGSYPVKLQCYRYERQKNGSYKWILRKTVSARASNYSSYTKYSARIALGSRGKWKIRARHSDSSHALTYSSKWRYVTVR